MLTWLLSRVLIFLSSIRLPWLVWLPTCLIVIIFTISTPWPAEHLLAAEQTIQATSCAFSSVQAAVQAAIVSGSMSLIRIPSGTCDWRSNVLNLPGGVSLKGAGKTATILRGSSGSKLNLITVDCANGKTSRVSDLTLIGKGNGTIPDGGLLFVNGCTDFMVFNSTFRDFANFGVGVRGNSRGVIFGNDFLDNYRANQPGGQTGYGVVVMGDGTWPPLELGTANAVFVESNYFSGNRHSIASNNGSRYVFRYNTLVAVELTRDFHLMDAHGLSSSPRGSRSWEIYHNTVTTKLLTPDPIPSVVRTRGGDGVIFNNTVINPATVVNMVEFMLDRVSPYPAQDQMTAGYSWNNTPNTLHNLTPSNLVEGRDYFQYAKPEYIPYTYPHPLRNTLAGAAPKAPSRLSVQ